MDNALVQIGELLLMAPDIGNALRTGRLIVSVIGNIELIVGAVGRWNPIDVACVRHVSFENQCQSSYDVVLRVLIQPRPPQLACWPDLNREFWESDIAFYGVRDFSLTICGPWDIPTPGFRVDQIRERQWEGQNLLVYDEEGLTAEQISFGARAAEVRSCQLAAHRPNSPAIWREYPGIHP